MNIVPPSQIEPKDLFLLQPSLDITEEAPEKVLAQLQDMSHCQMWRFAEGRSWARLVTIVDIPNLHVWHFCGERLMPHGKYIQKTLIEFARTLDLKGVAARTSIRNAKLYRRWVGPADKVEVFSTWEVK